VFGAPGKGNAGGVGMRCGGGTRTGRRVRGDAWPFDTRRGVGAFGPGDRLTMRISPHRDLPGKYVMQVSSSDKRFHKYFVVRVFESYLDSII